MSYTSIYNIVGLNNEINRLETQAKLGWDKEFRTLKWLGLKDGMKILDVGSGTGVYTELLLNNLPHSTITALEIDKNMMDVAVKRLSDYPDNRIKFKIGTIMDSGLKENSYDFIICRFVFQHLDNPLGAAKEVYKLLKPGGIVAIIDSDRGLYGVSDPDILFKGGRNYIKQIEKKANWNREIGRKLIKILKLQGFEKLDFEAVTVHSDIVGLKNIMGKPKISMEQYKALSRKNPMLAKIMMMCSETNIMENCTVIFLNLIAKGSKPLDEHKRDKLDY